MTEANVLFSIMPSRCLNSKLGVSPQTGWSSTRVGSAIDTNHIIVHADGGESELVRAEDSMSKESTMSSPSFFEKAHD